VVLVPELELAEPTTVLVCGRGTPQPKKLGRSRARDSGGLAGRRSGAREGGGAAR